MKSNLKRRDFLTTCFQAGLTGCALMLSPKLFGSQNLNLLTEGEIPDPKKLTYCGYKCPADCKFLKSSVENNVDLKKEAYKEWKIKEQYNVEFDAEKIYCFGCKTKDKPEGIVLTNCTVRSCAKSKSFDCCIECKDLTGCDKNLWMKFPDFKKQVIEMQKKYDEAKSKN